MAKVYRIENELGHGMYRTNFQVPCMDEMQPYVNDKHEGRFPPPSDDEKLWEAAKAKDLVTEGFFRGLNASGEKYRFGFRSIRQLKSWVFKKKWRKMLAESDLQLATYEASEVLFGNCQVMFMRDWSKRVVVPWEKVI